MAIVQIVFDIEEDLRNRFKAKVAMEGTTIRDVLTGFIEYYAKERKVGAKRPMTEGERMMQKLMRLEVLRQVKYGGRTLEWYQGKVPRPGDERREEATRDLLIMELIEGAAGYPRSRPHPFRLTGKGEAFWKGVAARIGLGGSRIDWHRAGEIEFPPITVRC